MQGSDTIDRRTLLKGLFLAQAALVTGGLSSCKARVPDLSDTEAAAAYINEHICPVETSKKLGKKTIVFAPESHTIPYHKKHIEVFRALQNAFGFNSFGIESHLGAVEHEFASKEFESVLEFQEKGTRLSLITNTERLSGKTIDDITTFEEFLDHFPLYTLAVDKNVNLYGLDDPETTETLITLEVIDAMFGTYTQRLDALEKFRYELNTYAKDLKYETQDLEFIKRVAPTKTEEIKKRSKAIELATQDLAKIQSNFDQYEAIVQPHLDSIKKEMHREIKKLGKDFPLPDIDEDLVKYGMATRYSSPFYKQLDAHTDRIRLDQRSIDAITLADAFLQTQGLDRTMIMYGGGHKDQMIDEMKKKNLSHIVLKYSL